MLEAEICEQAENGDDWHARWLTMQSAYKEYRRASEALECTRQTGEDSVGEDRLRLTMMEGQQRLAFEHYVDARIAFLESRFDEFNRSDRVPVEAAAVGIRQAEGSRLRAWLSMASDKPVVQTMAVILLCTMSYSLIKEQKRVQRLETTGEELQAALIRTAREVQSLGKRLDSMATTPPSPQTTQRVPPAPAPRKPGARPKRAAGIPATTGAKKHGLSSPTSAADRTLPENPNPNHGVHRGTSFSLSPSREFRRAGPLSVLLKSVNPREGTASLFIVSETTQVDVPHLRLNEPVWVNTGDHERLGMVADRITSNRLEGHILEVDGSRADLRAGQFRSRTDSTQ